MMARLRRMVRGPVRAVRRRVHMPLEFYRDYRRYRDSAAPPDDAVTSVLSGMHLEAQLTKDYHRVEKGLALRTPKQPFGAAVDQRLSLLLPAASAASGYRGYAQDARAALAAWNAGGAQDDTVSPFAAPPSPIDRAVLDELITSRHSVRDFNDTRTVDLGTIEDAVRLARHTPSVCNRQAARVHAFSGAVDSARVLAHQNGNSGFRSQVRTVLIVTVERGLFAGAAERNQRWVDGGLFAMTLVWALHGLGVASCMLNWSMTNDRSDALRAEAGISASEDIVCLLAVGYPSTDGLRVARSPRRSVEEILTRH